MQCFSINEKTVNILGKGRSWNEADDFVLCRIEFGVIYFIRQKLEDRNFKFSSLPFKGFVEKIKREHINFLQDQ